MDPTQTPPPPPFQQPHPGQVPPPYGMPPQGQATDTLSIVGLILAFLVPLAGLIVSLIALSRIKQSGQKGKGLAIAGIAVSAGAMILSVLWIIFVFVLAGTTINQANKTIQNESQQANATTVTGPEQTITVNKSATLADGSTLTVPNVIRNFHYKTVDGISGEVVLVDLKATTTSDKTHLPPTPLDMVLVYDNGATAKQTYNVSDMELKDAGLTHYDDLADFGPNIIVEGYVPFVVPTGTQHLTLRHTPISGGQPVEIVLF